MVTKGQIGGVLEPKSKRSRIAFAVTSIALTFAHLDTELLQFSAQSRARGKRRGFSPGAAARHSQSARVHTSEMGFFFVVVIIFFPESPTTSDFVTF
jgi:hypothetical protein